MLNMPTTVHAEKRCKSKLGGTLKSAQKHVHQYEGCVAAVLRVLDVPHRQTVHKRANIFQTEPVRFGNVHAMQQAD